MPRHSLVRVAERDADGGAHDVAPVHCPPSKSPRRGVGAAGGFSPLVSVHTFPPCDVRT